MNNQTETIPSQNPLRIAMFGQKRIPSREGGVEIVVEELSTRMVKLGHTVTVYNRKGHHVSGEEFDSSNCGKSYRGVRLKSVFTVNRKGLAALTSSFFASFSASFSSASVVHIHAEGPAVMCWLPRLMGKRVIVTIHGLDWQRAKWGKAAAAILKLGEKTAVRYADEIIVLSSSVQEYFLHTYGRKTHFIPNGTEPPALREADAVTTAYGLKKDSYILFLARLVPEKGLQYLIPAFKQVKTDKKLVIAGGSSDSHSFILRMQELAAGDDRILFTGFVQNNLLEELYSNAYLYVLPSDLEGMPLSLLEAMSYGNCCLVSDIPENREIIGEKGFTFRKGSSADLRNQLQLLCDHPEAVMEHKQNISEYVCSKYTWDDAVARTLSLYRKEEPDCI